MGAEKAVIDGVRTLYTNLIQGRMDVIALFADKATVDSPMGGKQLPAEFVTEMHSWLDSHAAHAEDVHTTSSPERVIHELLLHLSLGGKKVEVPVMLVADTEGDLVRDLRVYHSTYPLTGTHQLRGPIMQYDLTARPPEPVGTYHEALMEADAAKANAVFEPAGCVREPAGGEFVYCGAERTKWYQDVLAAGPIVLHLATITDDGETVVYECMADRWGSAPMPAQSGAAAYQRGLSGNLAWARIYDDVQPPAELGDV
jgi:hypothetical protein